MYLSNFRYLDSFRSGYICDQNWKLCEIAPNFACFWRQIFLGEGPKFLNLHYKAQPDSHAAMFHSNWPVQLGDPVLK